MTKEEAKIKLMKSGYTVVDENSVVTVIIPENGNIKNDTFIRTAHFCARIRALSCCKIIQN